MEIGNQNIEAKSAGDAHVFSGENHAFTGKVEVLSPLETEAERLGEELSSERDARLRLAAEYENYRRRTKREKERAAEEGKRELLERLLSIADDLDLTAGHLGETTDTVAEGVKLVRKRFEEILRENSVTAFKSEGVEFDPQLHEAFDVVHEINLKPGTVHTEIRRGYFWGKKLLRPALVVVSA